MKHERGGEAVAREAHGGDVGEERREAEGVGEARELAGEEEEGAHPHASADLRGVDEGDERRGRLQTKLRCRRVPF